MGGDLIPPEIAQTIRWDMFACQSCRNGSLLVGIELMVGLKLKGIRLSVSLVAIL